MNRSSPPQSKLFIRSEVLAVIDLLSAMDAPPKNDKNKQLKRLVAIENRGAVLEILLKELNRATGQRTIQVIAELLMDLGDIDSLQEPLWDLIKNPGASDEVKDAANLTLRHLGDESDPELYLEFLEDPVGLISRETERMLEVSSNNPEALIDFIDFIFSLPPEEQMNLIGSLHHDYSPEYLMNIYIPMAQADPTPEVRQLIISNLGQAKSPKAAQYLIQLKNDLTEEDEELLRVVRKSLNELRLAGTYKSEDDVLEEPPHPLTEEAKYHKCFATIPDGIGNQGLVISRKRPNGDITLMSVALSDIHGVIDCFGFYQLTEEDFDRIVEKFHEESTKIPVPPDYCVYKLNMAETLNRAHRFRVPYEYSCWKVLLDDIDGSQTDIFDYCETHAEPVWAPHTGNLYQHPDFKTWFLEDEDHPAITDALRQVKLEIFQHEAYKDRPEAFVDRMDELVEVLIVALLKTNWLGFLIQRLADAAYLLNCQNTTSFSRLAATEVMHLIAIDRGLASITPLTHFLKFYGRKCVEEELLRFAHQRDDDPGLREMVDRVIIEWTEDLPMDGVELEEQDNGGSVTSIAPVNAPTKGSGSKPPGDDA